MTPVEFGWGEPLLQWAMNVALAIDLVGMSITFAIWLSLKVRQIGSGE